MGEIDRIQQINPLLQTVAAPLRVGDDGGRKQQQEEQKKKQEDQVELSNEAESEEVGERGASEESTGGLDLAI